MVEYDMLGKTELSIHGIILQDADLGGIADVVAQVLGLNRNDVLVTDVRGEHLVLDILQKGVDASKFVGREYPAQLADEQTTPETKLIDELERARVRRALARVPAREQALLRAIYFEERVLEDAGDELGIKRSGAHRMHTRALGMLREALG